jgi:hypothetical protein
MEGTPPEGAYGPPGGPGPSGPSGPPGPGGAYPPQGPPTGYPPTQQAYGQPAYGGHQQGPGFGERASDVASTVGRKMRTPETKPFYVTSEFLVWAFCVIGVLIAGAVVDSGDNGDVLRANTVWLLIVVISFGYVISRGISKAGTKYRDHGAGAEHGRY